MDATAAALPVLGVEMFTRKDHELVLTELSSLIGQRVVRLLEFRLQERDLRNL